MSVTCLIIDDEPLAIDVIESYISRTDTLKLVNKSDNLQDAIGLIDKEQPDIVFMDINIRGINETGLNCVLQKKCRVIFISAYPKKVLNDLLAIDISKISYLNKPVSFSTFSKEVKRVLTKNHFH